nr:AAA family ATPase [uncultured Fluviicola sp.]
MDNVKHLHDKVFLFLEGMRERENEFEQLRYTFRKDNFGGRLENGYWFFGDEKELIISFWKGENWFTKKPNISVKFEYDKELIFLEVTVEKRNNDIREDNKFVFLYDILIPELNELEEYEERDYYLFRYRLGPIQYWEEVLTSFLFNEKQKIDGIINEHERRFFFEDISIRSAIGIIDREQFRRNLAKIKQYRRQLEEISEYENASYHNKQRPYYINSFRIQNFGPILNMDVTNISEDNRWIFITGANGSGKTFLLKALATLLGHGAIPQEYIRYNVLPILEANLLGSKGELKNVYRVGNDLESKYAKRSILRGFAAYGIYRTVIKSPHSTSRKHHELTKNGFLDSIMSDQIIPLIDFNKTIEEWTINETNLFQFNHREDFFVKALLKTVPGLIDIHFRKVGNRFKSEFYLRFEDGPVVTVLYDQLSSGSKSILSFVADIIVRFYKQQPEANDPSEFKGIVIVDEIDLHLHPQGQKDLILALTEIFPNIQFIVSTHSPIPLLAAPANSVFLTVKQGGEGSELIRLDDKIPVHKLLPNALYGSPLFNLDDYSPVDSKIDDLIVQNNFEEALFSHLLRKRFELQKK